ncbi:MAG: class I SAM-dependent RNA methyltransferase, partial [Bacteroidales bacterium]
MIAKTFQGLEDVLAQEIIALGGEEVEQGKRMVSFIGDKELMYKANLHLRTALRILKPIQTFTASNTDEVYDFLKTIKWENYIAADQTISIDSVVFSDNFRHSKFVTYRAKDAIVDYFQEKAGKRPSVRITNADLALNLHISGHTCTLSLDSSGESLHKRGYRVDQTEAPLNEVLAAGMILKSGWKGEKNFLDPMCGSGTLLIEAAMIATNTPPGVYRQGFAFEKWKDYDSELFDRLYNDESGEREFDFRIYGSDISPKAIEIARENIKSAGLSRCVNLRVMPFQQYTEETAPKDATMIMNPPYGERISSRDILSLYEMIGSTLKHQFKGYDAWILSYREECFEKIGLKPSVKFDLMNGGLDCEFRKYEIFAGKLKEFKSEGGEFSKDEKFLEIPEGTNYKKRELRKERFTDFKAGNSRGRRDDKPAGKGRPVGRRESTFKKFGDAPTERRPRTEGFERRPRPEGA